MPQRPLLGKAHELRPAWLINFEQGSLTAAPYSPAGKLCKALLCTIVEAKDLSTGEFASRNASMSVLGISPTL